MNIILKFFKKYITNDDSSDISTKTYGTFFKNKLPILEEWDKKTVIHVYNKYSDTNIRKYARFISFLGDPRLWFVAFIVFLIYGFVNDNDFSIFIIFISGFFQSYFIYYIIKNKMKRARPFVALIDQGIVRLDKTGHGYSFPSGHSHHSAILVGLLILYFLPFWWMIPILLIYNIMVPYSRIISGCHYPSDTIFAILEAYLELMLHWFITKEIYLSIYFFFSTLFFSF